MEQLTPWEFDHWRAYRRLKSRMEDAQRGEDPPEVTGDEQIDGLLRETWQTASAKRNNR